MNIRPVLLKSWPWAAAALSGVLQALCFAPWNQPQWIWVALLPLLAALWTLPADAPRWKAPLLGYVCGLFFFTATFSWLHSLADLFGAFALHGLPLLLALYLALYPAAWAWLVRMPPQPAATAGATSLRNIGFALRAASAWVALDWVRGWLFTGFGWNAPGVALHNNLGLIQIADLFGVYGISFLIVFANVIFALVARRLSHEASVRALPNMRGELMTVIVMIGLAVSYGVRAVLQKPATASSTLRAVLVQPNIEQEDKFDSDQEEAVLARLDRLMELAAAAHSASPDLVVWPEAATPRGMFADEANNRFTIRQTSRTGTPLLLGTLEPGEKPDEAGHLPAYNSAVLVGADKDVPLQSYRKRHLVPFGEFLPFRDWLPEWVRELVPGDLEPGKEANLLLLSASGRRLGALVCFEDSLAPETRALAREGAQVLVNLTNDAWFGKSAAAAQHLANAKFRAVETRLPLLRCANTGMTCVVDPLGRVEQHLEPFTEGIDSVSVPVQSEPTQTPYTRWGDRWLVLCGVLGLMLARDRLRPPRQS